MKFQLWQLILIIVMLFILSCSFAAMFVYNEIEDPFSNGTHQLEIEYITDVLYKFKKLHLEEKKYDRIRVGKLLFTFRLSLPWKLAAIGGFIYFFSLFVALLYFTIWRQRTRYNRKKTIKQLSRQGVFKTRFGGTQSYTMVHEVTYL